MMRKEELRGGASGGERAEHACVVGREVVTGRGMQGQGGK